MIGSIIGNRYEIRERLGGGGMAVVYHAWDRELGRDVAVKVLRSNLGSDEEFVRRFRREAQNAALLSHPNVVRIYDVGQEEDTYYIVLEYVKGRSLKEVIQQQGPLPIPEATRIAMEILSALAHAHQNHIVHRDIKPHNILISSDGKVKVTDFGIARATTTDTVTHTGTIMGSAHYFSPEQANGLPTGEKSDIYSLGIVLYEMVTGTVPFQGDSPITVALKHIREAVTPPSRLNAEVPVELDEIILRALEKDPHDRFPSTEAMRQALADFTADHLAGRTHMFGGDFPTMDLSAMNTRKVKAVPLEEEDEPEPRVPRRPANRTRQRPRKARRAWVWVLIVALILIGGIGTAAWGIISYLDVPDVSVPDVSGLKLTDAQAKLTDAHLSWEFRSDQYSDQVDVNAVISTDPPAGTPVKQGRKIGLVISKGPEQVALPDVRGKNADEARAILESSKFVLDRQDKRYDPTIPEGTVIDTDPRPLTPLKPGAKVVLTVSLGPLRVPRVVGMSLADATKALQGAGLVVGKTSYVPGDKKDTVQAANPAPDTRVTAGQRVDLFLAQGKGTPFSKTITVPGDLGRLYDVRVTLIDNIGGVPGDEQLIFSEQREGRSLVTITGTFYGTDAQLKVYEDNVAVTNLKLP